MIADATAQGVTLSVERLLGADEQHTAASRTPSRRRRRSPGRKGSP